MLKNLFHDGDEVICDESLIDHMSHLFVHAWKRLWERLRSKGLKHWIFAATLIVASFFAGHILNEQNFWIQGRYVVYQRFIELFNRPHAKRTTLVMINDEDYFYGPFAARKPLKRDLLAQLISKLDEANPQVIALDVNLSLPGSERDLTTNAAPYQKETDELINAVKSASEKRTVILARTLMRTDSIEPTYKPLPAIYDYYSLNEKTVLKGYITLPTDIRRVPVALWAADDRPLHSFASAIVSAVDKKSLEKIDVNENGFPYGKFIYPEDFTTRSASEILNMDAETLKDVFGFKIVIIGGSWHRDGVDRGPKNDGHPSPVGVIDGAYIHANYVEALLDSNTTPSMKESRSLLIDLFFAVILTAGLSLVGNFGKLILVAILSLLMFVVSYLAWQNLGIYFDIVIPVFLLLGHVIFEKIIQT